MRGTTRPDVVQWTLDRWQMMFNDIYGEKNKVLEMELIWHRMLEEIGELVIPMAGQVIGGIEWHLPDIFAWLCALTSRLPGTTSLDDIAWTKFRHGCPRCRKMEDCSCPTVTEALAARPAPPPEKEQLELLPEIPHPRTLDDWQDFFARLYGTRNSDVPPILLLGRMLDDISKVSRLFRIRAAQKDIEDKIASVFAWLLGVCNRYSIIRGAREEAFRLSDITWAKYPDLCAICHKSPCQCPSPITTVFLSWPSELQKERDVLEKEIAERLRLKVIAFPKLKKVHVPFGIMWEVFREISTADAAVVLLGERFSPKVYAELLQASYRLGRDHVFVAIREPKERDEKVAELINEVQATHIYDQFQSEEELVQKIIARLDNLARAYREAESRRIPGRR